MKKNILLVLILAFGSDSITTAAEDTWKYKTPMTIGRGFVSAAVVDGKIYVIGGFPTHYSVTSAVERYDPTTDTWTRMADMPSARCGHATCAYGEKIFVFGGVTPDAYSQARNNIYVYDTKTDTWAEKGPMPYANALCGVAVVDDLIYLVGGALSSSSPPVSRVMAYDPGTESWIRKADMPTARGHLSACTVNGKIYAIGGAPQNWQAVAYVRVEEYDPSTDSWTRMADMPTARATVGTCALNGKIHAIGGFSPSGVFTTHEVYDPSADTWITKSPMQQRRVMPFVVSVADKVYVGGGSRPGSGIIIYSSIEEYDMGLGVPSPDFNGDGMIDSIDICILVEHWQTDYALCDIAPPPFGDGIVDVQDLIAVAEHLFEEIYPPELVAYWKLDETEGDIAFNSTSDNHGVLSGNPIWQPDIGQIEGALELDGIDDYIDADFVLNPANGPFSVFGWIKGEVLGQVIISQSGGANWLRADPDFGYLMTELIPPAVGRFTPQPLKSDYVITDGQWHRIGMVWNGSTRALYVDDILVSEDGQANLQGSDGGLYIGTGKAMESGTYWSGLIDDVRIYNRALKP